MRLSSNQAASLSDLSVFLRRGQNLPFGRKGSLGVGSLGELAGSASVAMRRESKLRVIMAASMAWCYVTLGQSVVEKVLFLIPSKPGWVRRSYRSPQCRVSAPGL